MRRRDWIDPAPLEVSRPRLPWWTMLPRGLLLVLAPVMVTAGLVWLAVQVGRRLYRYPVGCLVLVLIVASAVRCGWAVPAAVAGGLTVVGWVWWWRHRASFERFAWRQLRSEYRRFGVYAFRWHRVMVFADLAKTVRRKTYVPTLARVRCDGWRDRVTARLLAGQAPIHYEQRTEALAHSFGARSCRVRVLRPRRIVLELIHADPLARPIPVPELAARPVDLKR